MAHSEGTLFVQQDATVSRALIQFLLSFLTLGDGGVGLLVTPVNTYSQFEKLCVLVLVSFCPVIILTKR